MTQWGLDNLFNPGKRHMDDEKRRLQSTREEIGDSSGGRRIDLEAGKVSIAVRRPGAAPAESDDAELEPALEVTEVPAVALANDDAEIAPEVVDEAPVDEPDEVVAAVDAELVAEATDDDVPIEAPQPVAAAARRKPSSAIAWSRRG